MRRKFAVIGGGISGLAAAVRLTRSDHNAKVVLLEASNRLGGVIDTTHRDGFMIESAADNFLVHPDSALKLCDEIGLSADLVSPDQNHRKAFVVHDDRLQPVPDGFMVMSPNKVWPILSTPILSWKGNRCLLAEAFIPPRRDDGDESLAAFVRWRLGREVFDALVQPLVVGIYSGDPDRLSGNATMPRFRTMERESGSLIPAAMKQRKRSRAATKPSEAGSAPLAMPVSSPHVAAWHP
ncbi:MAG: protoporphyrinogen oxidase [Pirellulaceae bacterium]